MSVEFTLSAEVRSDYGKGASRRLRRTNMFPGIIYGGGSNPTPISLNHNEILNNLQHEAFFSHILTLDVSGTKEQAIIKDIQRHPFKQQILHIDFQRIVANEAITVRGTRTVIASFATIRWKSMCRICCLKGWR